MLVYDQLILFFSSLHYIASDVNSEGYTVNATKYEVALFANESTNMVAGGTYLFTIGIIPVTLDLGTVIDFLAAVTGTGTDSVDFQAARGTSVDQVVVSAVTPLPVGVYTFSVSLAIFDFNHPDPVESQVSEAEVWILPPPRECMDSMHTHIIMLYNTV